MAWLEGKKIQNIAILSDNQGFIRALGSYEVKSKIIWLYVGKLNKLDCQHKATLFCWVLNNVYILFRRSQHQILVSPEHPPPYERHGRANAAGGY